MKGQVSYVAQFWRTCHGGRGPPAFGRNHESFLAKWPISPGSRISVWAVE